ncbi:MAG: rRNA maturation RNase YbeY [Bacteroidales bacterium]|nr:rRNA maturation RNase YbeY [Bacteroidales bacterium]
MKRKQKLRFWIRSVILQEGGRPGFINFILCSDVNLLNINTEYLGKEDYTDVITFDFAERPGHVSGDIYISLERVRENASKFNISLENELHRVMIHGVLHLLGYDDASPGERRIMNGKEDYYLTLRPEEIAIS